MSTSGARGRTGRVRGEVAVVVAVRVVDVWNDGGGGGGGTPFAEGAYRRRTDVSSTTLRVHGERPQKDRQHRRQKDAPAPHVAGRHLVGAALAARLAAAAIVITPSQQADDVRWVERLPRSAAADTRASTVTTEARWR